MPQLTASTLTVEEHPTPVAGWEIQQDGNGGASIEEEFPMEDIAEEDDWSPPPTLRPIAKEAKRTKMKKKTLRRSSAVDMRYSKMRQERLNLLISNPLDSPDKQSWVRDPKNWTSNKNVPTDRLAWAFHDILGNAGISVQRWMDEIYVEVGMEYAPAYIRAIQYFTDRPPRLDVGGPQGNIMVISSMGFKGNYEGKTNRKILPNEIINCVDLVTRMDDLQRCNFSERLRRNDMELFMWQDGNAAPFRPKCIAQKSQKK